jgi:23S rRNA-/tRNA-specific pseudouridylate synthase
MHGGFYPGFDTSRPPFELPVIYEDDHFAIINKPAGVVVYAQHMITIRSALPFYLKPPKRGTRGIIRRPELVHRLDKPTSGLLIVAKTRPAIVDLTRQFEERRVKKTYTAIVNGIPSEPFETEISVKDALSLGVNVDPNDHDSKWQLIDNSLDEKSAITVWKTLRYSKSLKAKDGILTLVEMKPKTGRYHQLRRHMAWVKGCSIVGDTTYDGGEEAAYLRGRGLFLCSNRVILEHPYYNTEKGRAEWMKLPELQKYANGKMKLSDDGSVVQVHASIDLPNKFQGFLLKEAEREEKFRQKEMPFRD